MDAIIWIAIVVIVVAIIAFGLFTVFQRSRRKGSVLAASSRRNRSKQ